jgi:TadE-like protein
MLNRRLRSIFSTLGDRERGQSAVEFVVVVPFLFLIFFLIVDFGWLFKNWIVVTSTASETARCAAVADAELCPDAAGARAFALQQIIDGVGTNVLNGSSIEVKYLDVNDDGEITRGDSVLVCIAAPNKFISPVVPFLSLVSGGSALSDPVVLHASNEMRLEQTPEGATPSADDSCDS